MFSTMCLRYMKQEDTDEVLKEHPNEDLRGKSHYVTKEETEKYLPVIMEEIQDEEELLG